MNTSKQKQNKANKKIIKEFIEKHGEMVGRIYYKDLLKDNLAKHKENEGRIYRQS